MENFSYPIKLEPLNRPVKARPVNPGPAASKTLAAATPKLSVKRGKKQLGLRELRERNKVTLESIAENTRIPLRHLRELERGDVTQWPTGVYAKSWARDYARHAKIDPKRVIALVAPVAHVEPTIDEIKQVREQSERKAFADFPLGPLVDLIRRFAAVIVAITLIVLAVIFLFTRAESANERNGPSPVGTSGVTQPK